MSLTPPEKEPTVYNKADYIAFGCIGTIISLIISAVLIALFVSSSFYRAGLFRTALSPLIVDAPLPEDERLQIQNDLDQVLEAYRDGDVTLEELQILAADLSSSPTLLAGATAGAYHVHIEASTLGQKERENARRTLYEFARQGMNGEIDPKIVERIGRLLQEKSPKGGWLWKSDLSGDEIRLLIDEAEEALLDMHDNRPDVSEQGTDSSAADEATLGEVEVTHEPGSQVVEPEPLVIEDGGAAEPDELVFPDVSRALADEINAKLGEEIIKP